MSNPAFTDAGLPHPAWPVDGDELGRAASVSPRQILRAFRSHAWLVAATMLACVACGMIFLLLSKPQYVSTAQIIVDPRELQSVNSSATPRNDTPDTTEAMVGNEMRVLKSNTLLSALIDKEDLVHDPEFMRRPSISSRLFGLVKGWFGYYPAGQDERDLKLAILHQLDPLIAVQRTERSFVVDVSVRTTNADKSARLANSLVDLYIAQAAETSASLNQRLGTALQNRLSELQAHVQETDQRVERFRIDNHLVSAGGVLTSDQRLRTLTDQLGLAQTREDEDRAKVDEVNRLRDVAAIGAVPEAVQSTAILQLRAQLADALRRRSALALQLGPRHPDLLSADQQVQTIQHLLDQELRRVAQAAKNQYGRSKESVRSIQQGVDSLSQSTLNNSLAVAQLRELEQEAEAARVLFTSFLSRSRELSEQTQIYTSNVRQISTALPAPTSSGLPTSVVLTISLIGGLVLGTLLAFLLEAKDRWFPGEASVQDSYAL